MEAPTTSGSLKIPQFDTVETYVGVIMTASARFSSTLTRASIGVTAGVVSG